MSSLDTAAEGRSVPSVRAFSLVLVAFVLIISLIVFVGGWLLGSDLLKRLLPPFAAMVPSTALSFFGLGVVLFHRFSTNGNSNGLRPGTLIVALIVSMLAASDLFVIYTDRGPSVDAVFWPAFPIGRDAMSPATAMCFLLAAASLAMVSGWRWKTNFPFITCATLGLLISMVAIVGYAFDATILYKVSAFTAMALHTAVSFVALFLAILLIHPRNGWLGILLAPARGSAGARRLFPLIVLLPFVFCLAALTAQKSGMFDLNFSFCLLALVTMVLLAIAILQNAEIENRADRQMAAALEDLNVAVADRDLLLRELYHRVKNNLQQINALIHMETSKLDDPRAKASFRATAGRVHALGTVHRLLISGPSVSQLSTGSFLNDLCENIGASYDATGQGVALHVDAADIPVTIDAAVPIGMLVNEIVTNSLKHAFRGRATGDIRVTFEVLESGGAQLTIADDGIGMPQEKADPGANDGTGMRIIRSFVKQIRGTMTIRVDDGTTVSIRIPPGFDRRGSHGRK
jgi:two-component sensor histidine kinase